MYLVRPPYLLKKVFSKVVWRMPTTDKTIYLTFDDGPIESVTPWVLDLLKKNAIKATFFCVGANVEKHPQLYRRILEEGHQTGNHTFNHLKGWNTHTRTYLKNVVLCDEAFKKYTDSTDSQLVTSEKKLFRPPYGKAKKSQLSHLFPHYSIIMWDVLSGDYDKNTSNEKCLSNIISNVRNGSIIVFHDSLKAESNLKYALPLFIEWALDEGYNFKSIKC